MYSSPHLFDDETAGLRPQLNASISSQKRETTWRVQCSTVSTMILSSRRGRFCKSSGKPLRRHTDGSFTCTKVASALSPRTNEALLEKPTLFELRCSRSATTSRPPAVVLRTAQISPPRASVSRDGAGHGLGVLEGSCRGYLLRRSPAVSIETAGRDISAAHSSRWSPARSRNTLKRWSDP